MSKTDINTLSCIMSLLLTALMIHVTQASSTEEQIYSNLSSVSKNLQYEGKITQIADQNSVLKASKLDIKKSVENSTTNSKPKFMRVDNNSPRIRVDFPELGNRSLHSSNGIFNCASSFTTGWKDDTSFKISTNNTKNNTWSSIYGKKIDVEINITYGLVTHWIFSRKSLNLYSLYKI